MEVAKLYATISADPRQAQSALSSVDSRLKTTAKNFKSVESNKINVDTSQAEAALGRLGTTAKVALGTFAGNLLTSAVAKIGGGLADIVEKGLDMNDVLERAQVGFTTMLGSADAAKKKIAELKTFAATTPFEFKGLVQNSQMLLGMGFRAEELLPTLEAVGNGLSAMGRTDRLENVLLQLGQMRAKGRVLASEINLIAETGLPVWQIMSERVGLTVKELQKLGEAGELNADVFQKLLFEGLNARYGGSLALASQTRTGLASNLEDILAQRAAQGTAGLSENLKETIKNTANFLQGQGGDALAKSLDTAGTVAATAFNQATAGVLNNGAVISKALETGGNVANAFSDGVVKGTDSVVNAAKSTYQNFTTTLDDLFQIKSPSRVMIVKGQQIAEGFIEGLESKQGEIVAAMARVFGPKAAQSLFNRGILFGPGFFTSGNASFDKQIAAVGQSRGIDPALLFAQLLQESRFNPNAVSPAGARGLAQFIPGTAKRFGLNPGDPLDSIRAQGDYMQLLLRMFGGRADLALAGYNAGENRKSLRRGQVPNIPETQNYVAIITAIQGAIRAGFEAVSPRADSGALPGWVLRSIFKGVTSGTSPAGFDRDPLTAPLPTLSVKPLSELANITLPLAREGESIKFLVQNFPPVLDAYKELEKVAQQANQKAAISVADQKKNLAALTGQADQSKAIFKDIADGLTGVFSNAFGSIFTEGFSGFAARLKEGFGQLLADITAKFVQAGLYSLFNKLFGLGLGGGGGFGSILGGLFGGGRAEGGPILPGRAYLVGERGPEIVVPQSAGQVLPNAALAGAGGITVVNHFNISAPNGNVRPESQRQISARVGEAIAGAMERRR